MIFKNKIMKDKNKNFLIRTFLYCIMVLVCYASYKINGFEVTCIGSFAVLIGEVGYMSHKRND